MHNRQTVCLTQFGETAVKEIAHGAFHSRQCFASVVVYDDCPAAGEPRPDELERAQDRFVKVAVQKGKGDRWRDITRSQLIEPALVDDRRVQPRPLELAPQLLFADGQFTCLERGAGNAGVGNRLGR